MRLWILLPATLLVVACSKTDPAPNPAAASGEFQSVQGQISAFLGPLEPNLFLDQPRAHLAEALSSEVCQNEQQAPKEQRAFQQAKQAWLSQEFSMAANWALPVENCYRAWYLQAWENSKNRPQQEQPRFEQALQAKDLEFILFVLGNGNAELHRHGEAKIYLEALVGLQRLEGLPDGNRHAGACMSLLAVLSRLSGEEITALREAKQCHQDLQARTDLNEKGSSLAQYPAFFAARMEARLGQEEAAYQWLEKALGQSQKLLTLALSDPDLAKLRRQPRFQSLIEKYRPQPVEPAVPANASPPVYKPMPPMSLPAPSAPAVAPAPPAPILPPVPPAAAEPAPAPVPEVAPLPVPTVVPPPSAVEPQSIPGLPTERVPTPAELSQVRLVQP